MLELNKIYCMDCIEGMKLLEDERVDFILTDPPYGISKEGIDKGEDLWAYDVPFKEMHRVLKDNSFCLTFASVERLPDVLKMVCPPFRYRWSIICYQPNNMIRGNLGFSKYLLLVVLVKGKPKYKKPMRDVLVYNVNLKKRRKIDHPTTKPIYFFRRVIEKLTSKGDLVLDPFIGSGTTAVACKKLDRRWIGIEINKKYCELAQKRVKHTLVTKALLEVF